MTRHPPVPQPAPLLHRRRAARGQRRAGARARLEDHRLGGRGVRSPPVPHRVDERRGAHRPRREGRPGHRGRVHRHRLPLPRDAGHGRDGPPALRLEHEDHDGAGEHRAALEDRPGQLLLGAEGPTARPGAGRQGRLDERHPPGRGRHPGHRPRRRPRPARPGQGQPHRPVDRPGRRPTTSTRHDVPVNPLLAQGYGSIGCMPCTEKVGDGEDARAGRWRGKSKTECGLHG